MIDLLKVHALVDGELTPEEKSSVEAEIAISPQAKAEFLAVRHLKETVAAKIEPIECEDVWNTCTGRLSEIHKTRRIEGFVGRYAWGLCMVFLFVIIGGGMFNRNRAGGTISSSSILGPWSGTVPFSSTQVGTSPVQSVSGPVNYKVAVRSGVGILGGVSGWIDGRQVARLDLRDGRGEMTLIVAPGREFEGGQPMNGSDCSSGQVNSRSCVMWKSNDFGAMLMGNRSTEELQAIAAQITIQ